MYQAKCTIKIHEQAEAEVVPSSSLIEVGVEVEVGVDVELEVGGEVEVGDEVFDL